MKKLLLTINIIIIISFVCCTIYDPNPKRNTDKITDLQTVIDRAKAGSTIDLSKYSIRNYNAIIDKRLSISNGNNLNGNTLEIQSEGVTIDNIKNVNVKTNSSLKISNSQLSNLTIKSTDMNKSRNLGRSEIEYENFVPPFIQIKQTSISTFNIEIINSYIELNSTSIDKANIKEANIKFTIKDTKNKIQNLDLAKTCQMVLLNGICESFPPKITGDGELTCLNTNQMETKPELIEISPLSNVPDIISQGEIPDFSNVLMIGTYQTPKTTITHFKANDLSFSQQTTTTFTQIEPNFTVWVDDNTKIYENGKNTQNINNIKWNEKKSHPVKISVNNKNYEYNLIVATESNLSTITVNSEVIKTQYNEGDLLDLSGLIVTANYNATDGTEFSTIITDYTTSIQNGTILTASDTTVTISYKEQTATINLNITPTYNVNLIDWTDAEENIILTLNVVHDQTIDNTIITSLRQGNRKIIFLMSSHDDPGTFFDVKTTPITNDTDLYIQWEEIDPNIFYVSSDGDDTQYGRGTLPIFPLRTIQAAVTQIENKNDKSTEYTIKLLTDINASLGDMQNFNLVQITKGVKITIQPNVDNSTCSIDLYNTIGRFLQLGNETVSPTVTLNNLIIKNVKLISGNGGVIYQESGEIIINNTTFESNSNLRGCGGAIYQENGKITINNTIIKLNKAKKGGAIYQESGEIIIKDTTFDENTSNETNDGNGGAIYCKGTITTNNTKFINNTAYSYGGAIYLDDGEVTICDLSFDTNKGINGGAIYLNNGTLNINNSSFTNNIAFDDNTSDEVRVDYGRAIYQNGGTLNLGNTTIDISNNPNNTVNSINDTGIYFNKGTLNLTKENINITGGIYYTVKDNQYINISSEVSDITINNFIPSMYPENDDKINIIKYDVNLDIDNKIQIKKQGEYSYKWERQDQFYAIKKTP